MTYFSNPWIWLGIAALIYCLYESLVKSQICREWQQKRREAAEIEHVRKHPDFYRKRIESHEKARQKQQV